MAEWWPTCRGNLCGPGPAHCQCLRWCNQFHTGTPSSPEQQAWAVGPSSVPSPHDEEEVSWSCRSRLKSCWTQQRLCCSGTEAQPPDDCSCQQRHCGKTQILDLYFNFYSCIHLWGIHQSLRWKKNVLLTVVSPICSHVIANSAQRFECYVATVYSGLD